MMKRLYSLCLLLVFTLAIPNSALAQTYYFSLDKETVHVYWEEDGTMALDYLFVFSNSSSASPIDFVSVGVPTSRYSLSNISAEVNGNPVDDIESSPYVENGFEVGLGSYAIPAGKSGQVHVQVWGIEDVVYADDDDANFASAVFSPTWFGSEYVYGNTDLQVTFHLPPGVKPDEPRWHRAPSGDWPSEPVTSLDDQGRVTYTWFNETANAHTQYKFGASFPKTYIPESAITTPSIGDSINIDFDDIFGFLCFGLFIAIFVLVIWSSAASARKRKMKYLPPKIRIEGHGIKRGLTAVEAAILMEHPMDKIMTMILFAVLKKDAATVKSRDPLKLKIEQPLPSDLRAYENKFLKAFQETSKRDRTKALSAMMTGLIKSVQKKMKGFSHKETLTYYRHIMRKAWKQVEDAQTPEVRSEKFDEHMGWTMLDKDFDDHTRDVFHGRPVYVPIWWHRYDPGWSQSLKSSSKTAASIPTGVGRSTPTMPHLPGSDFAASVVGGIESFAGGVVGDITDFTGGITSKTNPIPKTTSGGSRSGGGGSCACACACAGCACACAGGGR
ncbi:MAG: hypothetical protein IMY76_00220 [Chloroflexi bacterium]|nr:hypothetical protein [Chloroflexota bacterium]